MKKITKSANKLLSRSGFTLVELLTVMAILGILIAVAIAAVGIAQRGARDNTRTRDLTTIQGLLNDYYGYSQSRQYPNQLDISGDKVSINDANGQTTPVSLQQKGASLVTPEGDKTNITSCGDKSSTNSSTWYIGYRVESNNQDFLLCATLENGSIVNVSSGR